MGNLIKLLDQEARTASPLPLDADFLSAARWTRAYRDKAAASAKRLPVTIALTRPDGVTFHERLELLPWDAETSTATAHYLERTVKYLLWQKGGNRVLVAGCPEAAASLAAAYQSGGKRAFDAEMMGERIFGAPFEVKSCDESELPAVSEPKSSVGGAWKGCRIGFDLGGSDRKCAAVIDGKVVHSEEVVWNPVTTSDWTYHRDGIEDSLKRAAAHLPRVDAIGGSAAGVYVNNEVRVASLFRSVPASEFDAHVRRLFIDIGERWGVPLVLMNDGEVTALAGSLSLEDRPVLGMAFGTSLAGGYCRGDGALTPWLNELAFVPIDFRRVDGPVDDWSGDMGVGAQYLSQQANARLARAAGVEFAEGMGFPEQLAEMQARLEKGDAIAERIFTTIGGYLGHAIAFADNFYELKRFLALGRVTSGRAGEIIVSTATETLRSEFPACAEKVLVEVPDESQKRHGQAMVAASLPADELLK